MELVGSEYDPNAEVEKTDGAAAKPKKTVGQRLKAAAERVRGKKGEAARRRRNAEAAAGAARKVTTPRKAGGS